MNENAAFWDERADRYARSPIRDPDAYDRTLERVLAYLTPEDAVLEVGCGTGTTALRLAPHVARYVATDASPRMIEIAQEKAKGAEVPNLVCEVGTLSEPGRPDGDFDAVLAFNLLHLLEDLPAALARVHALLRPGGHFVSKSVCLGGWDTLHWRLPIVVMRALGRAPHVSAWTAAALDRAIEDAGFEIVETGGYPKARNRFVVARRA